MSKPLPTPPPLPEDGTALAISFRRSELHAVESKRDRSSGAFLDPSSATLFLAMDGRGHAIRFRSAEDAVRLALVLLSLADRMTAQESEAVAKADADLARIVAAQVAGNA